jgi:pimeloyl-ACP methyl ester carboxylesterase
VVNVDQPVALGGFQDLVLSVEPMLRGAGFDEVISTMFDRMQGPLPPDEAARVGALRRPVAEVVLGVWAPLLELSPTELHALVGALTDAVHVPYLALHGIDPGPDYGPWLEQAIPTATLEVWEDSGHYPHLVHPQRFLDRVRAFESSQA